MGQSMLHGSDLIYALTSLRKAVRDEIRKAETKGRPRKVYRSDLILPDEPDLTVQKTLKSPMDTATEVLLTVQKTAQKNFKSPKKAALSPFNRAVNSYLDREISVLDFDDFVSLNEEFCDNIPNEDFNVTKVKNILEKYRKLNFGISLLDDKFQKSELVYGIGINRKNKRITVCFRGSVGGTQDWPRNSQFSMTPLLAINATKLHKFDRDIKVHSGYNGYLNDELLENDVNGTKKYKDFHEIQEGVRALAKEYNVFQDGFLAYGDQDRNTKYKKIVKELVNLFREKRFKDYKLIVTGHSLGGALSQLLSFQLASDGQLDKHAKAAYPITAITFASPCVGNEGFRKAYQELEKNGLVHHLRTSNEGDFVPVIFRLFGYTQTGVHVHAPKDYGKAVEVGYLLVKDFPGGGWWRPTMAHGLDEHHKRLFNSTEQTMEILNKKISDFYKEHAPDFYKEDAGDYTK